MDLLPRVTSEFSSAAYWESFFAKRKHSFEWYGNYMELCAILHRYIKAKDDVLVSGCGNSELSKQMYDAGFQKITNIDISKSVIEQMRKKNKDRVEMKWLEMDLTSMDLSDGTFSVVLDKGTLDAMMSDSSNDANAKVEKIFTEISRVLRFGGRYICISLAQDHILSALMNFFPPNHWIMRMHKVWTGEHFTENAGLDMPVFVFIMTKFKNLPEKVFEVCLEDGIKPTRLKSEQEVVDLVKTQQYYALLRQKLAQDGDTEQPRNITLYSSDNIDIPRYTMHVIDMKNHKLSNKFGVFIVPRGREREWLFSTEEGRCQVAESAQFKRLVFVSLSREHEYHGMQQIQDELSTKVMELAPISLPRSYKAPFLSVGDNDLGQVRVRHQGQSSLSGSYVVEDYIGEGGEWYRQLVVDAVAKATVKLKEIQRVKSRKKGSRASGNGAVELAIDLQFFVSHHIGAIITGLAAVIDSVDAKFNVLVDVGGGAIASHLVHCFKNCCVTALERDPAMMEVTQKWFALSNNHFTSRLNMKIETLETFVASLPVSEDCTPFHAAILDMSSGNSSRTSINLDNKLLERTVEMLQDNGVFIAYIDKQSKEACNRMEAMFPHRFVIKCSEEVNDILICSKSLTNSNYEDWKRKAKRLERSSKNNFELCEYFDDVLKIS